MPRNKQWDFKDELTESDSYLKAVKREHRDSLLSLPNVNGVGIGYKITGGVVMPQRSVRVYVTKKRPLIELNELDRVPAELDGLPTDVIEVGEWQLAAYTSKERPALGGASTGDLTNTGTLGARFIDKTDNTGVVLSCNHVFSLKDDVVRNAAVAGTLIIQPGVGDGGGVDDKIALLKRWVKYVFPPSWNRVDAAIAEIIGPLMSSACIHVSGRYNGWRVVAPEEETLLIVQKSGRTTGHTTGILWDTTVDMPIDPGYGTIQFEDQIMVAAIIPPFGAGGDSGSMILDMQGRLVGLLWATSENYAVANPISAVLSELNISVCPVC